MKRLLLTLLMVLVLSSSGYSKTDSTTLKKSVYVIPIRENIMPSTWRLTQNCLNDARNRKSDLIIIDMNTYGGIVEVADSIRTAILECDIPVVIFINNQAVSAGALISLAADSIYMQRGATFGAATVVNGNDGSKMPDKYQSFMRAMMRSTAEAHGKLIDRIEGEDTIWRWHRDPKIAESMVDPIGDTSKVLSLTTAEAIEIGFCEGQASSIDEVVKMYTSEQAEVYEYKPTTIDSIMGFLTNPMLQSVLILLMIGGIYFEFQTPGIGFPLVIALCAAFLYFSPLWFEKALQTWEILVFILGVVLILLEIFVIPGFGIAGISGIIAIIIGLSFAMIDNDLFKYIPENQVSISSFLSPLFLVIATVTVGIISSVWLAGRMLVGESKLKRTIVLTSELDTENGFVASNMDKSLIGQECVVVSSLRPSGKVQIEGHYYDAISQTGRMIDKGQRVKIVNIENSTLYCDVL